MADIREYLPVRDVAAILGRTPRTIQRYIAKGYLRAEKIGGRFLIERSQLRRFVLPEPGNPQLKRRKDQR